MKSMNRMAPSAGKLKKEKKRAREISASVDEFVQALEKLPPAERQEVVDLLSSLSIREKRG